MSVVGTLPSASVVNEKGIRDGEKTPLQPLTEGLTQAAEDRHQIRHERETFAAVRVGTTMR